MGIGKKWSRAYQRAFVQRLPSRRIFEPALWKCPRIKIAKRNVMPNFDARNREFMTDQDSQNLFAALPTNLTEESVNVLAENPGVRIERIVSTGQRSKPGFWYDQNEHEWVVVLKGHARLLFEDEDEPINMRPGDHALISAHRRHRVEWTTPDEPTVWLAVFYSDNDKSRSSLT